uniref:Mab-21 domain-containing protein n=1 Tax=Macrostomum lignano TaxID=282301 RepID=A0A1I8IHJ4_9PLAT
ESEFSKRLHESLSSSGFTRINAAVQSGTAAALEKILRQSLGSQCFLVGSFADGWGNCLTGICGRTDADSDMDVTEFQTGLQLHIAGSGVHDEMERKVTCKEVEFSDGHIKHQIDSSKPNVATSGMTLRPSVDIVRAIPCCFYPEFEIFRPGYKSCIPEDILSAIRSDTQCHAVAAAPPGLEGQCMRFSTTLMERALMHSQLFVMLKYIIKRVIVKRVKGLKTYHAKNLLLYMLDRTPDDEWRPHNLIKLVRQSLQLLLDSLTDSNSSEQQCMQHFFMRDAAIYLRKDHEGKTKIKEVVSQVMEELPHLMSEFEQTLMKNSPSVIEFHPFLIMPLTDELSIPESDTEFEYHQIYDAVKRALEMLSKEISSSDEASHVQQLGSLLNRIPDCARTARESLRALMGLREGKPIGSVVDAASSTDVSSGIACPQSEADSMFHFSVEEGSAEYLTARRDFVWKSLLESDSAWKFMFDPDRKLNFPFLPDHMRHIKLAFPWRVPYRSCDCVFINFHALYKALQLEARKLSGDDEGVNTLLGDFGSTRLDTQELLMMLHYCSDEAKLVEIIHSNRQMIVDTGLAGPVLRILDERPALRQRCVRATWAKVEELSSQRELSSAEERLRVELRMWRARHFLWEKEGI